MGEIYGEFFRAVTAGGWTTIGVVPVLVGPLSALMALLPAILVALGSLIISLARPRTVKRLLLFLWAQKLVILPAVVVVGGIGWGGRALWSGRKAAVSAAETAAADWPLWRGQPSRTARVPDDAPDPASGRVRWSFTDGKIVGFFSSPAVAGNRVYATSALPGYFSEHGGIYSVDADTGTEVWAYRGDYRATFSSPAIGGRYLVVGEGLHLTEDARVFCLDREESERRRAPVKLWEYRTASHVESSPAIVDGRAYIGAGNDGFYCFALDPGPDGQARVLWHLDGADYPDCETSPVVHEWRVYFGLGIGGQALVCADAETGKELWRLTTPAPVFSAPAIHNGRLFFGLGWGDFVNTAEEVAANLRDRLRREGRSPAEIEAAVAPIVTAGEVWAVDPADQRIIWTFKTSAVVLGAVAADGERVFFNARDGQVYSVAAADGQLHRRHDLHAPIVTSPAVGREHVYVTTLTGRLVAFEKERLTPVWQVMLRSPTISSPAVARGHVYVGTSEGGLLCVGSPGGEAPPVVWRGERGGPAAAGCADGSPIPPRGAYAWDFAAPLSEGSAEAPSRPTSPAAPLDHALYIGWSQGGLHGLRRLNADKEGWSLKPAAAWFVPTANPVRRSPAADARGVYGVDGVGGESGRYLRALDANGNELWRRAIAREAGGTFFLSGDRLFIADRPDGLSALDTSRTGAELWSVETGAVVGEPGEGPDLVLVVAATREAIALDAETGLEIWRRPLTAAPRTGPIWFDEAVWVGEEDGLTAYPIFDDARPLRAAVGAIAGPLAVADDHVFAVTADGALWAVRRARTANEASSGGELEAFRLGEVKDGWPPLVSRSVVLYAAENAIRRHDRTTGETETWTLIRPQWPGALTTPMTMADSHVFFGSERRGLVCIRPKE